MFVELLSNLTSMTRESLYKHFVSDSNVADYYTWYMRVVTAGMSVLWVYHHHTKYSTLNPRLTYFNLSGYLRRNADRFLPFVECSFVGEDRDRDINGDMARFCSQEVEAMGRECEQVQVMALAEALGVQVEIEYLDGR